MEGSIKQLLNCAHETTRARWKVEHVAPLLELGAPAAGLEREAFWNQNYPDAKIERSARRPDSGGFRPSRGRCSPHASSFHA